MKILSIYNTFANNKQESDAQFQGYVDGISSILMQKGVDQDVVISSCLNTTPCRTRLMDVFESNIRYSFIDELQPLPVTVNLTVMKMEEKYGPYDAFLYVDSGVRFRDEYQLAHLVHTHYDYKAGMTSALTSNDTGLYEAMGWGKHIDDHSDIAKYFDKQGVFKFPIGGACCLHLQLFDRAIYESFGKIYTDIWASHCSESCFSHICGSIGKNYIITNEVVVDHLIGMDGASGGFSPRAWMEKGGNRLDHPYKTRSIFEIFKDGQHLGLGFQEFGGGVIAPKDQFSPEGFALNQDLKHYIKNNVFLSKELLDYNKIKHQLITL